MSVLAVSSTIKVFMTIGYVELLTYLLSLLWAGSSLRAETQFTASARDQKFNFFL